MARTGFPILTIMFYIYCKLLLFRLQNAGVLIHRYYTGAKFFVVNGFFFYAFSG